MSYTSQFPADFQVPDWIFRVPGLEDISWGNDSSPSLAFTGSDPDDENYIRFWVDAEDPEARENSAGRFAITVGDNAEIVWSSEDEASAQQVFRKVADAYNGSTEMDRKSRYRRGGLTREKLTSLVGGAVPESRKMVAEQLVQRLLEDTRDCWIVRGPSGVSTRVYGVKSADDAIAKWAAKRSYKTLEKAKKAGATAKAEKGMTQSQQGQRNAEKHRKWISR